MASRYHVALILFATACGAVPLRAQSPQDAPCTVSPEPQPCTTAPPAPSGASFPFPGASPAPAPPAQPSPNTQPPAATKPSGASFPFPGQAATPSAPASPGAFPFPGSSSSPTAPAGESSSSSSSSDTPSPTPDDPGAAISGDPTPGDPKPALHDEGTHGRRLLPRVNPKGTKLQTIEQREAEDLDIARYYLQTGNLKGAYLRTQDAVKAQPNDPAAHFALAETAQRLAKHDEAVAEYTACLKLDPDPKQAAAARKGIAALTH